MDINTVYKVQKYLKDNNIADLSKTKSEMTLRAEEKGEICSKSPKCDKCVLNNECNMFK